MFSDDKAEFVLCADQGVQTQYLDFDLRELSNQMSTIAIVPATGLQGLEHTPFRLGSETDQSPLRRSMIEDLFSLKQ